MNIHINRSVNKKLEKGEVNINIELSENNNEVESLIEYIKEYGNNKIVVIVYKLNNKLKKQRKGGNDYEQMEQLLMEKKI